MPGKPGERLLVKRSEHIWDLLVLLRNVRTFKHSMPQITELYTMLGLQKIEWHRIWDDGTSDSLTLCNVMDYTIPHAVDTVLAMPIYLPVVITTLASDGLRLLPLATLHCKAGFTKNSTKWIQFPE